MNFEKLFADFSDTKVAIIGDVMLDTYWWGQVDRISPEAPVPIVALKRKELRVGGAANVALNVVSLGAKTTILSIIGNDADGKELTRLLNENQIDTEWMISTDQRITTNKTRIMSRNQQMMRLDAEMTADISSNLEEALLQKVKDFFAVSAPDVLIFEDYNKGVLTPRLIEALIILCKEFNVITAVDPKQKNFLSFK
jgi:rfaE bifunctional protein kinase chain/domain